MIEKEYKFLVNEEIFYKIKQELMKYHTNSVSTIQINYYYDDPDDSLFYNDITLRVRQIGKLLTKQTKERVHRRDALMISNEKEEKIDVLPYRIDNRYHMLGQMITERQRIFLSDYAGHIDFDRNIYLGICDYEIEFEVHDPDSPSIHSLINQYALTEFNHPNGKYHRFHTQLELFRQSNIS